MSVMAVIVEMVMPLPMIVVVLAPWIVAFLAMVHEVTAIESATYSVQKSGANDRFPIRHHAALGTATSRHFAPQPYLNSVSHAFGSWAPLKVKCHHSRL